MTALVIIECIALVLALLGFEGTAIVVFLIGFIVWGFAKIDDWTSDH